MLFEWKLVSITPMLFKWNLLVWTCCYQINYLVSVLLRRYMSQNTAVFERIFTFEILKMTSTTVVIGLLAQIFFYGGYFLSKLGLDGLM